MPNGLSGLVNGIIGGIQPGIVIGDRIAALRSNNRMQDVQNRLDAGGYTQDAAGQQQLQADLRAAQEPLSARGLDAEYGDDQYRRLLQLQSLRGDQQAGSAVAPGGDGSPVDYSRALSMQANSRRGLGDLPGAMQADQMAGQVSAGRAAINRTGAMTPGGVAPGELDTGALAAGTAANNANYGDAAGATAWQDQAKVRGDAAVQGMLGRALTVAQNPALGGLEGAAPYLHSAAQMMGYGDVQWSPSSKALVVLDKSGAPVATLDQSTIGQFAQTIGNDPGQLLNQIRGVQVKNAEDSRKFATDTAGKARDAMFDVAKQAPSDAMLNQAQTVAMRSQSLAEKTGWKVLNARDDTETNTRQLLVQPPGMPPLLMTVGGQPDPNNPTQPAFRLQRQDGTEVPVDSLGPAAQQAVIFAQAQQDQAMLANMQLNRDRYKQQMANVQDVANAWGGGAFGGSAGAFGAPAAPAPTAAQATGTPQDLFQYQSKYPQLDALQEQQESGGDQSAVSPKGARGVMQLMPATAREREAKFGLPAGFSSGNGPQNALANRQLGRQYRDELIDHYAKSTGDQQAGMLLGLAAYNWGPANVDTWLASGADPAKLPTETRKYLQTILQSSRSPARGSSGMMGSALPKVVAKPITPRNALPNGPANKYLYRG